MKEENDIGTSAFESMYMPTLPDRLWLAIGKRDSYWADDSKEGSILFTREGVLNLKKFIAEKKDIKINLLMPTKYFISADIENLKRAFINILDNAIRYSPANEEIQIEIFKRDSSVVMRVRDKGIGLEENEFNDIFSRFYRGDPSRTKFKKSGSGLGLSITKKIINNNKGFIKAFNHKDGGAIFETIFPCLDKDL